MRQSRSSVRAHDNKVRLVFLGYADDRRYRRAFGGVLLPRHRGKRRQTCEECVPLGFKLGGRERWYWQGRRLALAHSQQHTLLGYLLHGKTGYVRQSVGQVRPPPQPLA